MTSEIAGWYWAEGDPVGTKRYWNGGTWEQGIVGEQPWQRFAAKLIDSVTLGIIITFLVPAVLSGGTWYLLFVISLVVVVAYEVGFVVSRGGTPGKLLMGLRVVEIATGQTPPSGSVATRRWAPSVAAAIPLVGIFIAIIIMIVSCLWLFTDANRQSVFDRAAKTYVVRIPRVPIPK